MTDTTPYERVKAARSSKRPTGIDYIRHIFTDFLELHGDRRYADDSAMIGGVAYLGERPVTVLAIEKGHTAKERSDRKFGNPHPEGYRKALRLMKQAEKFRRPVVCLIDTSGAYCGIGAEQRGQGQAIAENLMTMMQLDVPVIAILIGEGGSGGALALAVADRVWMLEGAVYSVISPEGCASILWKDAAKADLAAESLRLTAEDALSFGIVERVLGDSDIGTQEFYNRIRNDLIQTLQTLSADRNLLEHRYERFRRFGRDV
ncbi:MAG: acetyl-CoA carboxylase carboxyltransferase subunit alpha [Clostridia bacterium]|nr:acetyl-CoA carboxylase carboxyltransferase subunit alpha [Clostridia bacterium]